jgi:hypothetical protein
MIAAAEAPVRAAGRSLKQTRDVCAFSVRGGEKIFDAV